MKSLALSKMVSGSRSCKGSETEEWSVLEWFKLEMLSLNLLYWSCFCLSNVARIPLIFLIRS